MMEGQEIVVNNNPADEQQIQKNKTWSTGKCAQENFDCNVSYHALKVNDKRIVMFEKSWGHFKVFNRQTMELECILPHKVNDRGTRYDILGNCLAASAHDNWDCVVHVWDLDTKEKLHTFNDYLDWPGVDEDEFKELSSYAVIMRGPYLLSLLAHEELDVDGKRHPIGFMLTMRKFDMDSLKKSTIVHQLNIDDKIETFVDIYMDDKFIVMIYEKFDSPDFYKIIQVRSTETLDIVQTIRVKDKPSIFVIGYIHYSNGLLIFGSSRFNSSKDKPQYLKIYDVESGKIIARFLTGGQFETIRLIADKYIMALGFVDNKGQIRAWDLQAAIGSASSKHGTPLFSLPDEIFCPWEIIGDESQVFVFGGVTVTEMRDGKFVGSHTKKTIIALDFRKEFSEDEDQRIQKFFNSLTFSRY